MPGQRPLILALATESCAYPGADYVGQIHSEYPNNVYIFRIPAPALLPDDFYLRSFEKGVAGIIVMACGHECPYEGAYDRLAARIGAIHVRMKARGMDLRRLKLCAICTVCARPFLKEVHAMDQLLREIEEG